MMVEVISNQNSILNIAKFPHILSISHLKYHSLDFSVLFYLQADWLVTSQHDHFENKSVH